MLRLVLILCLSLVFASPLSAGEPSVQDIYNAASLRHYDQAEAMIRNVIQLHPKSSKAHYVAAEVYIMEGKKSLASQEYQTSLSLDPQLSFATPTSIDHLRSALNINTQTPMMASPLMSPSSSQASSSSNFIYYLIGGFLVMSIVGGLIRRIFGGGFYGGGYPTSYGGLGGGPMGYGYPPQSGGLGSSIINGLAGGAALGAGMVAGEALAKSFTHPDGTTIQANPIDTDQQSSLDPNFGVDTSSSWGDSSSASGGSDGGSSGGDWS